MSRIPRAEAVIPLTIVLAAIVLGASEFMVTFEFTPPGGDPLQESRAADRHSYALLILGAGAIITTAIAVATGVRAAALATAVFGGAALLLFLVIDLPDAGKVGPLSSENDELFLASVRADPQAGFWFEAIGSIALALAAGVFATFSPEQLRRSSRIRARRSAADGNDDEDPRGRSEDRRRRRSARASEGDRAKGAFEIEPDEPPGSSRG